MKETGWRVREREIKPEQCYKDKGKKEFKFLQYVDKIQ